MKIRNIKIKNEGYVSRLAGYIMGCGQADGNFSTALFKSIEGLYFDSANNQLLISDANNNRIKVMDFNCKFYILLSISFHHLFPPLFCFLFILFHLKKKTKFKKLTMSQLLLEMDLQVQSMD